MKKLFLLFAVMAFTLVACNKQLAPVEVDNESQEIVLNIDSDEIDADVSTKTTAITSVPGTLYWGTTTGTSTETAKWSAASASVSSSKINTGKYQTASPTAYNYYVSNQTFSVGASTTITVANNNTDVLAGRTAASTSATPSVALDHIFARTGSLTCNTQSGYTISGITWKIKSKDTISGTAGTYNMTTGAWTAASTTLSSYQTITGSSDLYLIPGAYTIEVGYTLTNGDWTKSFTKHADVTLVKGKVNNITATATGGTASQIVISVSITAWGTQAVTATWTD